MDKETLTIIISFVTFILGNGFVQWLINRHDAKKNDKNCELIEFKTQCKSLRESINKVDRNVEETKMQNNKLSEAMILSLKSHKVTFKALREGHINGDSEVQDREIDEFLRKCTYDSIMI